MSWELIKGHDKILEGFQQVARRNRLAHAYLFLGPEGVGKRMFAQELGKALLCEGNKQSSSPLSACDACPSCRLIAGQSHPDFFIVRRPQEANEFPIELMRELCQKFTLKSARGQGKVAILDDADDLNDASANCFLKTLEEPPSNALFILIGTLRSQQLPTIRSRCQSVRFAPLPSEIVTEILQAKGITQKEQLASLIRLCPGSPGQALQLADTELWQFRDSLLNGLSAQKYNPNALAKHLLDFVESAGKEGAVQRQRAEQVLMLMMAFLRDCLRFSVGEHDESHSDAERNRWQSICVNHSAEQILSLLERCMDAIIQIRRYIQLAIILEGLLDAF